MDHSAVIPFAFHLFTFHAIAPPPQGPCFFMATSNSIELQSCLFVMVSISNNDWYTFNACAQTVCRAYHSHSLTCSPYIVVVS